MFGRRSRFGFGGYAWQLNEAITLFIHSEPETAQRILRDLVNAPVG